ncbi:MAG: tetratricopeptide repeat protein [Thermodesulfobacteriota bacterium]
MDLTEHVQRSMNRGPGAKSRFNLLREETPPPPAMKRGLCVLASFVLCTTILVAGIRHIQPGQDRSLMNPRLLSRLVEIDEAGASVTDPFSETFLNRDEVRTEPGSPAPEERVPLEEEKAVPAISTREGETPPQKARRSLPVHTKEQVFYRKAQAYHREKNFEMATEMYRRVLHEKPGHRDALLHLSSIYMEQSAYAEAYPLIMELLRLNPGDPQSLANLAITEIALERPEQAIAYLDEALALEDPPRFTIYFHQGVARSRLHRLEEAITWYRKAENLDPGHKRLLFNMAVTFDRMERYNEALECYTRFLKAGESSSPKERRDVEKRIGVLVAYLAEAPKTPSAEGNHRHTEQER